MVNIIAKSSIPNWPPQHWSLAIMRREKAITVKLTPTKTIEIKWDRSLIGCPQADVVAFFVTEAVSLPVALSVQTWTYLKSREWYSVL
jgi:hypothetical protein